MFNTEKFYSREAFMEFLLSKGDEEYDYFNHTECCFAQWGRECLTDKSMHIYASGFIIFIRNDNDENMLTINIPDKFNNRTPLAEHSTFANFYNAMIFGDAE